MPKSFDGKVYLATNTRNGMRYIGITVRPLNRRIHAHVSSAIRGKGSEHTLQAAIRDFGRNAIEFEQIDSASNSEELVEKEVLYIDKFGTLHPNGYNQNRGGALGTGGELYEVEGEEYFGLSKLADAYGILEITMQKRMKSGRWTIEQACGIEPPPKFNKTGLKIDLEGLEFSSITEACGFFGLKKRIVDMRINRLKWSLEEAFELKERNLNKFVLLGEKYPNFLSACKHFGLNEKKVESRIRNGWSFAQAFDLEDRPIELIKCGGEEFQTYGEIAERFNIRQELLKSRIYSNWTIEEAVGLKERPPRNFSTGPISVVVDGKKYKSRAEACRFYGIDDSLIRGRLKSGKTLDEAFGVVHTPKKKSEKKKISVGGTTYDSLSIASQTYGIKLGTVSYRLRRGWTAEQALGLDPPPNNQPNYKSIKLDGKVFPSVQQAAEHYGLNVTNVRYRLSKENWTVRQAFELDPPPTQSFRHYIVTDPDGKEFYVDDFPAFAREKGLPKDGDKLRALLYNDQTHTWRGWKIRLVDTENPTN